MILKGDKLKNALRHKGIGAMKKETPAVRCHFDNGQEYFGKDGTSPLFSWRVKGDFRLPIIPFLSVFAALLTVLGTAACFCRKKK